MTGIRGLNQNKKALSLAKQMTTNQNAEVEIMRSKMDSM